MFFLPIRGIIAIAEKIQELIETETSDRAIKQQLLDLQMQLEMNQISIDEYDQRESDLLEMLEEMRVGKNTVEN